MTTELDESMGSSLDNEEEEQTPYDVGLSEIPIKIRDGKEQFEIIVAKPSRAQHEVRERMSVIIKRTAAKVDDQEAVTVVADNAKAKTKFVKAIALRVVGYRFNEDDNANSGFDAQGEIAEGAKYLSEDEIKNWDGKRTKDAAREPI